MMAELLVRLHRMTLSAAYVTLILNVHNFPGVLSYSYVDEVAKDNARRKK